MALRSLVLAAEVGAVLLGGAAPDARVLVGGEGVLEALLTGQALTADGLGGLDLLDRRAGGADGEEEVRVRVATGGVLTPLIGCKRQRQQVARVERHGSSRGWATAGRRCGS